MRKTIVAAVGASMIAVFTAQAAAMFMFLYGFIDGCPVKAIVAAEALVFSSDYGGREGGRDFIEGLPRIVRAFA